MLLYSIFSRLNIIQCHNVRSICTSSRNLIQSTPILYAEPLKRKKKMDPQVIRQREERKRKKIEKQIRRLERNARQLKPIDELEVPLVLIDEKEKRLRNVMVTPELKEKRSLILNKWSNYRLKQKLQDFKRIDNLLLSQQKALQELRYESEELYQAAIQIDPDLMPFHAKGPVSTPPINNYNSPDGEYSDIGKKWD